MITLATLTAAGDELFASHILQGSPDWKSLHDSTPDDAEPDEDEPASAAPDTTAAADAASILNRAAGFREWVAAAAPDTADLFEDLAAAAQDRGMSDAAFLQRAEQVIANLHSIDPTAAADMATAMEAALGGAVVTAISSSSQ